VTKRKRWQGTADCTGATVYPQGTRREYQPSSRDGTRAEPERNRNGTRTEQEQNEESLGSPGFCLRARKASEPRGMGYAFTQCPTTLSGRHSLHAWRPRALNGQVCVQPLLGQLRLSDSDIMITKSGVHLFQRLHRRVRYRSKGHGGRLTTPFVSIKKNQHSPAMTNSMPTKTKVSGAG
jgi:hypothetical protein